MVEAAPCNIDCTVLQGVFSNHDISTAWSLAELRSGPRWSIPEGLEDPSQVEPMLSPSHCREGCHVGPTWPIRLAETAMAKADVAVYSASSRYTPLACVWHPLLRVMYMVSISHWPLGGFFNVAAKNLMFANVLLQHEGRGQSPWLRPGVAQAPRRKPAALSVVRLRQQLDNPVLEGLVGSLQPEPGHEAQSPWA